MTDRLAVVLDGLVVGFVERTKNDGITFTYAREYPRGGIALSPALPIGDRRHANTAIKAFMDGLLPDDPRVRGSWAQHFGVTDNSFDLLSHMGQDCAGAVQFAPEENLDSILRRRGEHVAVNRLEIGGRLRDLREAAGTTEPSWTLPRENWSLPGMQPKIALAQIDGVWHEAHGAAATTHIIKPGILDMKHQAAVEFATMRAARRLGLPVADVYLEDFDGEEAVVIRRFDRTVRNGSVSRIHQVDMCQALGVSPSLKYERSKGPSARRIAEMLRKNSTNPNTDVRRFSDALLFNYISGSPDGHAKNFGMLFAGSSARLAPLYDLATGLPYDGRDAPNFAAFHIGGVSNFGEAYPKHWVQHAQDFGLDPEERTAFVRDLADRIPDAFHDAMLEDVGGDLGRLLWRRTNETPGRLTNHAQRVGKRLDEQRARVTSPAGAGQQPRGVTKKGTTAGSWKARERDEASRAVGDGLMSNEGNS